MNDLYQKIVLILKQKKETISCMESCTGGLLASKITNIDSSSDIFKVGIVTYSDEYKIKFGVKKNTIKANTVYSLEVAKEMARAISDFAKSEISIGITGQIGNENINMVFISILKNDVFFNFKIEAKGNNKEEKKEDIINFIANKLIEILN